MGTAIVVGALVIFCYIGLKSTVKRMLHGCCGGGRDKVEKVKAADTDLSNYLYCVSLQVQGMTCRECKRKVENAFNRQTGMYAVVDLKKGIAKIYTKQKPEESWLRQIIYHSGYEPGKMLL